MEAPIEGGATMWARQTIHSNVFNSKPDKWFKIWFYIVNRVNFKDTQQWKRGECFIPTGEIEHACRATKDQVKKCLKWLRESDSISTKRSTRGIHVKVLKYNVYQDVESYRSTKKAPEKHQRSTTIGEECNNEITLGEKSPESEPLKDNNNTMGNWNRTGDDYEEGFVDYDDDASLKEEKKKTPPKSKYKKTTPEMEAVFQLFKNPAKAVWHMREVERVSAQTLYETYGVDTLKVRIERIEAEKGNKDPLFPLVTTPSQLLDKMPNVERYFGI